MRRNKLKIAYMVGTLNQGGLESLVADICKRHRSLDFDVVCIYRHEGNYSEAFHSSGARMVQITCSNIGTYIYQLRKVLLAEHIDIVHAHTQSNALVCLLALMGTSIPVITTLHGFSFSKVNRLYRNIIYRGCKKIICVSHYQKQYYQTAWHLPEANKLEVIYNGIDFAKFDAKESIVNSEEGKVNREEGKVNSEEGKVNSEELIVNSGIQLAMVGSFMGGRSQHVVVKSIDLLKQRGITDFDFYFIGRKTDDEPWRYDDCVRYCEEHELKHVHFMGGRKDVPSLLKAMDGFVYSTEHDTFGIAVVEAMAAGLPVIVNDWAVMREITNNGNRATLFRTEDAADCADKMEELINQLQHKDASMQKHCKQIAKEVRAAFSIEKHIKELERVYDIVKSE